MFNKKKNEFKVELESLTMPKKDLLLDYQKMLIKYRMENKTKRLVETHRIKLVKIKIAYLLTSIRGERK